MKPLLILQTGDAVAELKETHGDFVDWFSRYLSVAWTGPIEALDARTALLPPGTGYAGVVVTGSPASVYDDEGWIPEAGGWVLGTASAGIPVLGVCFGHQLVADAWGGRVEKNPKGRETGTVEVHLTDAGRADPLFDGLPETLVVQQSHQDSVLGIPEGAVVLAGNGHSEVQAFALGETVRTVQFHPEFDGEVARGYVDARADRIHADAEGLGLDGEAAVRLARETVRDSEHGPRLLANWVRHYVHKAR